MEEEEKDVKKPEDSSPEEPTEEEVDALNAEANKSEDADEKEEDLDTSDKSEEEEKPEPEEPKEDLKAELEKERAEKENLKKALKESREKKSPSLASSVAAVPADEKLNIDPNQYVRSLVLQAEEEAKSVLYKEFPELHPDNDPDNTYYNEFAKDFAVAAKMKGVVPVSKDNFLQIGRLVMSLKTGRQPQSETKKQAIAEAHKEAAKGNAANISGTPNNSKPDLETSVTDEDRRIAKSMGMTLKSYMKNKNVYDDGVPV